MSDGRGALKNKQARAAGGPAADEGVMRAALGSSWLWAGQSAADPAEPTASTLLGLREDSGSRYWLGRGGRACARRAGEGQHGRMKGAGVRP